MNLTTMAAWTQGGYGPASTVLLGDRPVPTPKRGEVLLRIRATALNAGDVRIMLGDPLLVRPAFGVTRPRNPVRGMDVAGSVVSVGDGVTGVAVGDELVVELPGGGGLAEFAVAPAARAVTRPEGVSPVQAATVPIAGGTAMQALDLAGIAAGGRMLVIGASGGVGTFVVQLARHRGVEVHATGAERHHGLLRSLGAAQTYDRDVPLGTFEDDRFDAVIDIAGTARLRDLRRLVVPGGAVVLVAGTGGHVLGPVPRMLRAAFLSIGSARKVRFLAASAKPEVVRDLLSLVEQGEVAPVIEREFAFADAGSALAHVEAGHTVGKVVVLAAP